MNDISLLKNNEFKKRKVIENQQKNKLQPQGRSDPQYFDNRDRYHQPDFDSNNYHRLKQQINKEVKTS